MDIFEDSSLTLETARRLMREQSFTLSHQGQEITGLTEQLRLRTQERDDARTFAAQTLTFAAQTLTFADLLRRIPTHA